MSNLWRWGSKSIHEKKNCNSGEGNKFSLPFYGQRIPRTARVTNEEVLRWAGEEATEAPGAHLEYWRNGKELLAGDDWWKKRRMRKTKKEIHGGLVGKHWQRRENCRPGQDGGQKRRLALQDCWHHMNSTLMLWAGMWSWQASRIDKWYMKAEGQRVYLVKEL